MGDTWTDSYRTCLIKSGATGLVTGFPTGVMAGSAGGPAAGVAAGLGGLFATYGANLPECVDQADAAHLAANPLEADGFDAAADAVAQLAEHVAGRVDFAERKAEAQAEAAALEEGSDDPRPGAEQAELGDVAAPGEAVPVESDSGMTPEEAAIAAEVESVITAIQDALEGDPNAEQLADQAIGDYLDTLTDGGPETGLDVEGLGVSEGGDRADGDGGDLDESVHPVDPVDPGDDGMGDDPGDYSPGDDDHGADAGDHDPHDFEM